MEQYLQELDKINELLVHTDVKPAPFWSFLLAHPWLCLGVLLFVVIVFHAEEEGSVLAGMLTPLASILAIGLIVLIIGLFTDLATPKHDQISVTKDSYVKAINYVADLPEDKLQQLYNQTDKYEFTDAQREAYYASRAIIRDCYHKIHEK